MPEVCSWIRSRVAWAAEDSPCVDAGFNDVPNLPETDLLGRPRILHGGRSLTMDMGATQRRHAPSITSIRGDSFAQQLRPELLWPTAIARREVRTQIHGHREENGAHASCAVAAGAEWQSPHGATLSQERRASRSRRVDTVVSTPVKEACRGVWPDATKKQE